MSLYGTVTRLAPAGRHPPEPSHQTKSFMKKALCGIPDASVPKIAPKRAGCPPGQPECAHAVIGTRGPSSELASLSDRILPLVACRPRARHGVIRACAGHRSPGDSP